MDRFFNGDAHRPVRTAALIYGAAWLACVAFYWGSLATGGFGGGAIMSYLRLVLYVILPVAGGAASFMVGRIHSLGRWRFLAPFASAALYLIFTCLTFGLSTPLGFTGIVPVSALAPVPLIFTCAFLGLAVGLVVDMRTQG